MVVPLMVSELTAGAVPLSTPSTNCPAAGAEPVSRGSLHSSVSAMPFTLAFAGVGLTPSTLWLPSLPRAACASSASPPVAPWIPWMRPPLSASRFAPMETPSVSSSSPTTV